jgi:hypothetical protein
MRVTDAETMEVVEWVLAGEVQQDIVGLINQAGGKAVGLTGRDGGMIRARKLKMVDNKDPNIEHDVGQVGDIVSIDPSVVKALQDDAVHPRHQPDRLWRAQRELQHQRRRGGQQAGHVLKAEKLMLLTNTPGVLDKAGNLLTDLTARRIDELFADGTISGGMLPKIAGALDAAKSGVNAVHIIDGRVPHAMLLEILTEQAYGTMIRLPRHQLDFKGQQTRAAILEGSAALGLAWPRRWGWRACPSARWPRSRDEQVRRVCPLRLARGTADLGDPRVPHPLRAGGVLPGAARAAAACRACALFELDEAHLSVEIDSGCIYISGAVEFDDRPGPVRDALAEWCGPGWRAR